MIALDDIRLHCRVDGTDEDALLSSYLDAAKEVLKQQTSRSWYEDTVPETDPDGLLYNAAVEQALLLLIGHWYAHRESVSDTPLNEIPQSFFWIVQPYRIYGL